MYVGIRRASDIFRRDLHTCLDPSSYISSIEFISEQYDSDEANIKAFHEIYLSTLPESVVSPILWPSRIAHSGLLARRLVPRVDLRPTSSVSTLTTTDQ